MKKILFSIFVKDYKKSRVLLHHPKSTSVSAIYLDK
jgi:hypothetical protein